MAIFIDKRPCFIIDRTFTESSKMKEQIKSEELYHFFKMLKKIGVDLIEVNSVFLKKVETLPLDFDFVVRIDSMEDFECCYSMENVKFILLTEIKILKELNNNNHKIIFECKGNEIEEIEERIKDLSTIANKINFLRIQGLSRYMGADWQALIKKITTKMDVGIEICPGNEYCLATSVVLDLLGSTDGVSLISASFNGLGSFAPLEELFVAAKVIKGYEVLNDLSLLQTLKKSFENLTGETVANDKPIIGENIFKYESGIHADGIEKNPMTYEPYQPEMVGLKRKLVIGKHSGKKAVIAKLKELNIIYSENDIPKLLNNIKKMSIIFKREILDYELVIICNELTRRI